MDLYLDLTNIIIKEQQAIIGPVALDQARQVSGIEVSPDGTITISGDGKTVLANLVHQFSQLFGRASIEVCKEAVRHLKTDIPGETLPDVLR